MIIANDNTKCSCEGPVCTCGALGVVKDGAGVRVSAHLMDAESGNLVVDGLTIDRAVWDAYNDSSERAYDESKHRLGGKGAFTADDAARCLAARIRQNEMLQANIDHHARIAADPASYARDGRLLTDLDAADRARENMISSYNDWRK